MRKIWAAGLVVVFFLCATKLNADVDQAPVRIFLSSETTAQDVPSERDCVVIYQDETYHVERRRQEPHQQFNNLLIFESRLTPQELRSLDESLLDLAHAYLAEFEPPFFPMTISTFQTMIVEANVSGVSQKFGYIEWPNKVNHGSPNNTPEATKVSWQKSAEALSPLREWAEDVIQLNAKSSNVDLSASNLCGGDNE